VTDIDDHNGPFAGFEGQLEPDCTTCSDECFLIDPAAEGHVGSGQNCPECNPTPEQDAAAAIAKWCPVNEEDPF
jgi:hypothetical protein